MGRSRSLRFWPALRFAVVHFVLVVESVFQLFFTAIQHLAQSSIEILHLLGWRRVGIRNRLHAPIIAHLAALETEETMNILKISLAVLIGVAFGIALFHTPQVKAQQAGNVVVFIHPVTVLNTKLPTNEVLPGSRVDGISCIPKPIIGKLPDAAVCYVATTN